ncbi:NAD(+) diphosphatase [Microbacterium sp.]|uniref:NAD(+) diphosphatase n=1 Tax=Microbacterium sp. TaxID=51671 RepID=UPI0039E6BF5B
MSPSDAPQPPALARAGIDRAAHERTDPDLLARLRADPATRVVAVHGDRARLSPDGGLRTTPVAQAHADAQWAFLGRDAEGAALLVAAAPADAEPPADAADGRWVSLRAAGGALTGTDAAVFVEAVCLGRWLADAPFCPACGARTEVRSAGWSRQCPACGREHFPRTDPAVIVAVVSPDRSRLLLGQNALWADRHMFSAFAGFVEAGESLEAAIVRELYEEAGVHAHELRYLGSQAWPYPRSLMLGFHATATDAADARPDGEEIVAVRWFDRDELKDALAGRPTAGPPFALPGSASIAHSLIVDWVEGA